MASVTRTAVVPLQGGVGYELTTHEQWTPDAVTAAWDGTNAAGNFVVAASFYNNGGALIDRAFPEGVTSAPGDTGRTFFRPFKRGAGASAPAGASDYVFVAELATATGDWAFADIPQDARHLVLYIALRSAGTSPLVQFNGDGGSNYQYLATVAQDFNGTVTNATSSSGAGAGFIELTGMDTEYPCRAVVTIPYYALDFSLGFRDRSLEAAIVAATDNSVSSTHLHRHSTVSGWWNPSPGAACPPITEIALILSGGGGNASLYKVI